MVAIICNVCHIRRAKTGSKGTETSPHPDMCNYCHEEGGWENQHSDYGHDGILQDVAANPGKNPVTFLSADDFSEYEGYMTQCWICHPELNLAQRKTHSGQHGPHGSFTRRPQLNHKGHSHPQAPAARRECKKLFWAEMAKQGVTTATVLADHFLAWDAKLDGFGKPLPAAPKMTVVPRGPKGGVINQLKASKPSKFLTKAQGMKLHGKG